MYRSSSCALKNKKLLLFFNFILYILENYWELTMKKEIYAHVCLSPTHASKTQILSVWINNKKFYFLLHIKYLTKVNLLCYNSNIWLSRFIHFITRIHFLSLIEIINVLFPIILTRSKVSAPFNSAHPFQSAYSEDRYITHSVLQGLHSLNAIIFFFYIPSIISTRWKTNWALKKVTNRIKWLWYQWYNYSSTWWDTM